MDYNKGMVDYEKLKGKIAEREEKEKFDAQKDYSSYNGDYDSSETSIRVFFKFCVNTK